jgi:ubiquinone/menaquinone biosynthesis C-methylase UbiE
LSWQIFDRAAATYEGWYETSRGRRVDRAERAILAWLLAAFPAARSVVEVGCGTGHFTRWLTGRGLVSIGVDRAPAMLAEARRCRSDTPLVLADGDVLPFRNRAVDLVAFVTTLEFLDAPDHALAEAVRVARQGVIALTLNRWSLGGLSRRYGRQRRRPLLGQARDYSVITLRTAVMRAATDRLRQVRWSSTLFPGQCAARAPIPFGQVIALAALLAP